MTTICDIERLFRDNYKAMFILANRLLRDEESARDIVHDVFTSLLGGDVSEVTPAYLMRGVRFACLNHIRNLSVRDRLAKLYSLDCQELDEAAWPDEDEIALLNEVVDKQLSEQTRRVVRLRFNAAMKYREIAEELSISEVAVYKHLRHAMNVLRQNLNKNER
jgi:RNA polymerase sigma factor (sigma-70 family)